MKFAALVFWLLSTVTGNTCPTDGDSVSNGFSDVVGARAPGGVVAAMCAMAPPPPPEVAPPQTTPAPPSERHAWTSDAAKISNGF